MNRMKIYDWIATSLVLFFLLPGSVMKKMQTKDLLGVFKQLGYHLTYCLFWVRLKL
ncbi:hypothetical protein [Leptospira yanagawae]|uniref:hypothetical protein n=1 Tax=Leptospira yanagawae TaxID=293069 RepID=UPI0031335213